MKFSNLKYLVLISLILFSNSCLRFDMEYIKLTLGIPENVHCSFIDREGNDLVFDMMKENNEVLLEPNVSGSPINTDYYFLELKINGTVIQAEPLKVNLFSDSNSQIINPITNKETGNTILFAWDELFTDEFLASKKWRDLNIEYRIFFPQLFKDDKEHILNFKIKKDKSGAPDLTSITLDGTPVVNSDEVNFCFIVID